MPQAKILVGGVPGSNTDVTIATSIQLANEDVGGEVTYLWTVVDQPDGTADSPSSTSINNPTMTFNKEGTYCIRQTVNLGLASETTDQVVVSVRQLKTRTRIPAAGESTEAGLARGWAADVNAMLGGLDNARVTGVRVVGKLAASIAAGKVCYVSGVSVIKSGLPGQETVPLFSIANATDEQADRHTLFLMEATVAGASSGSSGDLATFIRVGLYPVTGALGSTGGAAYVSNTGSLASSPGAYIRRVGTIVLSDATTSYVLFDGALRSSYTQVGFGVDAAPAAGSSAYMRPGSGASSATAMGIVVTESGWLRVTSVHTAGTLHVGANLKVYVKKNGSTIQTLTIAPGAANPYTGTNVDVVAANDVITVQIESVTGTSTVATFVHVTLELVRP